MAEMTFGTSSTSIGKLSYDTSTQLFSFDKPLHKDNIKLSDQPNKSLSTRLNEINTRLNNLGFKQASINVINDSYIDAENTEIYALGKILYGRIAIKIPTIYKNDGDINLKIADFKKDQDGNSMLLPHADINLKVAVQYRYAGGAGNTYTGVTYGEVKIKTNGEIWFSVTIPQGASMTSSAAYTLLCDNYLNKVF